MYMKMSDAVSGFDINFSRMQIDAADLEKLHDMCRAAMAEMALLEAGKIKNPDENRKVTHFTDRAAYRNSELFREVEEFAGAVRSGAITGGTGKRFEAVVLNGIGGSALGPQLLQFAINGPYWNEKSCEQRNGSLKIYFLDNTDSAGIKDLMEVVDLESTLQLCISKSGGTQETLNNLNALINIYTARGLNYGDYACAVTMPGSLLDNQARSQGFLKVFPMSDSIGGRTSETSVVGHVPAALTGIDFRKLLDGACRMDEWTRNDDIMNNPALMLAAMWYLAGNGKGDRNMIIEPCSDRLAMLARYLQQLVMESLGKEQDLDGNVVNQGLNVFGNKCDTDAHAFIQQLHDGRDDFFITFIEVMRDAENIPLNDQLSMGDYLHSFMRGLAVTIDRKKRMAITMEISSVSPFNIGMIIALYERAVAIYAEFIHVNAFNQPGVQAYKLAAKDMLKIKEKLFSVLPRPVSGSVEELAAIAGFDDMQYAVAGWLNRAAANPERFNVERKYSAEKEDYIYYLK